MTPTSDPENKPFYLPAAAGQMLLELSIAKQQAELHLVIASNMARLMVAAPADWELRAENGAVYFAPATVVA